MNCREFEQLVGSYLDGDLAAALRLEFDAHRLRCVDCQQTLAVAEAVENTLALDDQVPELSDSFTDRVMDEVHAHQATRNRNRVLPLRIAVAGGMVLQAAAVLLFAIMLSGDPETATPTNLTPDQNEPVIAVADNPTPDHRLQITTPVKEVDVREAIVSRVENRVLEMQRAGETLGADLDALFFSLVLPPEMADETAKLVAPRPLELLIDTVMPAPRQPQPREVLPNDEIAL